MTHIVAFATRKGGAGKTTDAQCIAALAAAEGRKTLLVDLDQEGHATFGIGGDVNKPGSAKLLMSEPFEAQNICENLDLIGGNQELEDPAIKRLEPEALADVLAPLAYEMIVVDCPPNMHELQKLGVVAAKSVVIPIDAHPYAINCATRLIEQLEQRQKRQRSGASRWAIVANRLDTRRKLDRDVVAAAETLFKAIPIFRVAQDTALAEVAVERAPITKLSSPPRESTMKELGEILSWILDEK